MPPPTEQTDRPPMLVTIVTGSRLVLALGVAVLTRWSGTETWAVVLATSLVLLIEISDLADGYLARRNRAVSQFGKLFDPYTDSLSRITVYWSLAVTGRCLAFVPLIMAIRDITVGYTRILLTRKGKDVAARWWGKAKAVTQGTCALLLMSGPMWWGDAGPAIIYALSFLVVAATLGSAVLYARVALRRP
ncbi:MAG: CDP-alcohol phosphatidyltransferase family protein [Candidatus Brocadiaceae bacterium]|jgi:CDP-diacylglycerol--glycerol-3-phosphate 3-phosphatidyltransferase